MTILAPTEAPELVIVEQRQPDVPLVCTWQLYGPDGNPRTEPCDKTASWEALCMGCGHVFRRCENHMGVEKELASLSTRGSYIRCAHCDTPCYPEQYGRIGA